MNEQIQLLEPQESFPLENWIRYARTLKAENEALREWIVENEQHDERCPAMRFVRDPCTCGYDALLKGKG